MFDAASRYLLFPLKRAVTDALLPQLETATPADLCGWLLLADKYVHACHASNSTSSILLHRKLDIIKPDMTATNVVSNLWQIWSLEASGALLRRHGSEL